MRLMRVVAVMTARRCCVALVARTTPRGRRGAALSTARRWAAAPALKAEVAAAAAAGAPHPSPRAHASSSEAAPAHRRRRPVAGEAIAPLGQGAGPLWAYDLDAAPYGVPRAADWDLVVDVRSPSEFAEDHIPGAINLPVLDDDERAEVGTLYVRQSKFDARKRGAALVAKNLGGRILSDSRVAALSYDARILVYCWRGGERSNAVAHTLSRVGWHTARLVDGYKRYRLGVRRNLEKGGGTKPGILAEATWTVVDGPTGTGKGLLLVSVDEIAAERAKPNFGALDLEILAKHRGSALGDVVDDETLEVDPQPTQKAFESAIVERLVSMSEAAGGAPLRVFVEAESPMIGRLNVPPALVGAMRATGDVRFLEVPMRCRVAHLRRQYAAFETDLGAEDLKRRLAGLARQPQHGAAVYARWAEAIEGRRWNDFVEDILVSHYDAAYAAARKRLNRHHSTALPIADHSPQSLRRAAESIALATNGEEDSPALSRPHDADDATAAAADPGGKTHHETPPP